VRPPTELDVLRKEVELLNLKLKVVEGRLSVQEAELRGLRDQARPVTWPDVSPPRASWLVPDKSLTNRPLPLAEVDKRRAVEQAALEKKVEDALDSLKKARGKEPKRRAAEALEAAARKLQEHLKQAGNVTPSGR
jgi:hypothetical protein